MKRNKLMTFAIWAVVIVFLLGCEKKKEDNTSLLAGLALASQTPVSSSVTNYEAEAANAGYALPNAPIKGVSALVLADSSTSLDVREETMGAFKKENLKFVDNRYTPTSTSSTTRGTCIWTTSSSDLCIYNYAEGACTTLGQSATTTSIDFTTDTTSSTCTSRGYISNCTNSTVSGVTYTQCSSAGTPTNSSAVPTSYYYNTTTGVISYGYSINSSELGTTSYTVQIWINGQSSEINFSSTGSRITNRLVLNSGRNYVLILVTANGSVIARSHCYRIDSSVQSSAIRTELTWNGSGDLDLHIDDGSGGKHVFFGSKTYLATGYNIALDVDNTVAYGPENIRIFTSPVNSTYRFYVNYYSGYNALTATAKIYNGTTLLDTKTLSFTTSDVSTNTSFHSLSKLVGTYNVSGTGTGTGTGGTGISYFFESGLPSGWTGTWIADTTAANCYSGSCLQSPTTANSSSSSISFTANTNSGSVTFYRKVSSESGFDYCKFTVDGNTPTNPTSEGNGVSGTSGTWVLNTYTVSSGSHTFAWTYSKDSSSVSGSDKCWIDNVTIP